MRKRLDDNGNLTIKNKSYEVIIQNHTYKKSNIVVTEMEIEVIVKRHGGMVFCALK
jgi:hypothetical protein